MNLTGNAHNPTTAGDQVSLGTSSPPRRSLSPNSQPSSRRHSIQAHSPPRSSRHSTHRRTSLNLPSPTSSRRVLPSSMSHSPRIPWDIEDGEYEARWPSSHFFSPQPSSPPSERSSLPREPSSALSGHSHTPTGSCNVAISQTPQSSAESMSRGSIITHSRQVALNKRHSDGEPCVIKKGTMGGLVEYLLLHAAGEPSLMSSRHHLT